MKRGSFILFVLLLALVASSCSSPKMEVKMAPASQLPASLQSAPVEVQELEGARKAHMRISDGNIVDSIGKCH